MTFNIPWLCLPYIAIGTYVPFRIFSNNENYINLLIKEKQLMVNEYEEYLESESLRTGNTYVYRANTGIIETYSDGKLIEVTGTRPSNSGGGYISVEPSSNVSGGYSVSTDTPSGGTSVTELSGTTSATQEQLRQGAFTTTNYDYTSTIPKEKRIGLVEQKISNAQIRPVAYNTPTSSYVPSTTDKYLPVVAPISILQKGILPETKPDVYTKREQFSMLYAKFNPFNDLSYDKQYYSKSDYITDRQIFLGNVDNTNVGWKDVLSFVSPVSSFVTGGRGENAVRGVLESASYGFYKQEELGYGKGAVYQNYISRGYSPSVANIKTDIAFKRFKSDVSSEWIEEGGVGIVSNFVGGLAVTGVTKGLGIVAPQLTQKTIYYGSRVLGMSPAGAYEGISFLSARKGYVTKEDMTTQDYLIAGGLGAVSSVGAQIYMEQGVSGIIGRAKNIPVVQTNGVNLREKALYTLDIQEPVSDAFSSLGGAGLSRVRVTTLPLNFGNTFSDIKKGKVTYDSSVFGGRFEFQFSNPFSQNTAQTQNLPSMFVSSKTNIKVTPINYDFSSNINSNTGIISSPRPTPNVFPNILPEIRPSSLPKIYVQPKPQPVPRITPNVFPNVLPETKPNVFPNVFVGGGIPFVPPMGGGYGKTFGFNTRTKQKKGYVPSLTAIGFNIRAKKGKRIDVASGLSIRPII